MLIFVYLGHSTRKYAVFITTLPHVGGYATLKLLTQNPDVQNVVNLLVKTS